MAKATGNPVRRAWIPWAIAVGVIVVILLIIGGAYNSLVNRRENVKKQFANVQVQYQRRSDLVPNLVNTVKAASNFEQSTLTAVVDARAKATSVQVDSDKLSPEQLQQYQAAQSELSSALSRLLVTVESYPQIKSVEAYRDLQVQLEGTENRIAVARRDYNDASNSYNASVQRFPTNVTANVFGFDQVGYFQADPGTEKVPKVNFTQ